MEESNGKITGRNQSTTIKESERDSLDEMGFDGDC